MVPVARRNLFAEKTRLAMSALGVAFSIVLILIVLALYRGFSGIGGIIEELPADLWVVQQGTTDPFHSGSLLDESVAEQTAALPEVGHVTKVLARQMGLHATTQRVYFMALDATADLPGLPKAEAERFLPNPGEMTVDEVFARKEGLAVGDVVDLGPRDVRVSNVFSGGNAIITQFAFLSWDDAQAILGVPGAFNYLLVRLKPGASGDATASEIEKAVPGTRVFSSAEFADAIRQEMDETFLPVISLLVVIGFVVGVAVIGLTTYTATIERSREYGVIKAIGAPASYLYRVVAEQSLILGSIGFAVGLAATIVLARMLGNAVPEFVTDIRWYDVLGVLVAAMGMAGVSSYIPARRIGSIDPATVFHA